MDNRNRHDEQLGVNKMGKNIRKSPLHQPNFPNPNRQQPQPQVYNINKNDFRNIVQQLTGSPSRHSQEPLPRPPHNPPKPPSMRLQKIRPPPLTPMNRPQIPIHHPPPAQPPPPMPMAPIPYSNAFVRPPSQFGQLSPTMMPPTPVDTVWANTAESPITAYMRYLQNSIIDSGPGQAQAQPQFHPHPQPQFQHQPHISGQFQDQPPNPHGPPIPSPQMNGPALLPSPISPFPLPSPSGFLSLLSPRSPYPPLPSPGYHFPPPLTPNFAFSPMAQPGILGPGPHPPVSPGMAFPLSPPGFFPIPSPGWRDH